VSVHNKYFESGLCNKYVREDTENSVGRDVQNMWKRLDMF